MFCKNCGKKIADDSKFCPECGTPCESNNAASPANGAVPTANGTAPQPAKTNGCLKAFLITLAVLGGLFVILIIFGIFSDSNESNSNSQQNGNQVASQESEQQMIENNANQLLEWIKERYNMNELARDEGFKELKGKTVIFTGEVREVGKTFLSDTPFVSLTVGSLSSVENINIQFNIYDKSFISVVKGWKKGETHTLKGKIGTEGDVVDDAVCKLTAIIE